MKEIYSKFSFNLKNVIILNAKSSFNLKFSNGKMIRHSVFSIFQKKPFAFFLISDKDCNINLIFGCDYEQKLKPKSTTTKKRSFFLRMKPSSVDFNKRLFNLVKSSLICKSPIA